MIDNFGNKLKMEFTEVFKVEVVQKLADKVVSFIPKFLVSIILFLAFVILYKMVNRLADSAMDRLKWEGALRKLLKSIIKIIILGFGIITALGQMGINIGSLIAGVGVVSLAVSFAAKDTLENFISGITILADKPFKVGDIVELGDEFGTVVEITLRTTRIRTIENYIQVVPNSKMVSSNIVNRSLVKETNVFLKLGIGYESDVDKAREIILGVLKEDARIQEVPEPKVVVTDLGDSSVNLRIKFVINEPAYEIPMRFEYTEKIKKALDKGGINIPFPIRTVYLHNKNKAA